MQPLWKSLSEDSKKVLLAFMPPGWQPNVPSAITKHDILLDWEVAEEIERIMKQPPKHVHQEELLATD